MNNNRTNILGNPILATNRTRIDSIGIMFEIIQAVNDNEIPNNSNNNGNDDNDDYVLIDYNTDDTFYYDQLIKGCDVQKLLKEMLNNNIIPSERFLSRIMDNDIAIVPLNLYNQISIVLHASPSFVTDYFREISLGYFESKDKVLYNRLKALYIRLPSK